MSGPKSINDVAIVVGDRVVWLHCPGGFKPISKDDFTAEEGQSFSFNFSGSFQANLTPAFFELAEKMVAEDAERIRFLEKFTGCPVEIIE